MIALIAGVVLFLWIFIALIEMLTKVNKVKDVCKPHGGVKKCYKEYKKTK